MITTKNEQEVEAFLREFKPKFSIWGIIFLHRDKNEEALRILGITPVAREEIIKKIEKDDYSHFRYRRNFIRRYVGVRERL